MDAHDALWWIYIYAIIAFAFIAFYYRVNKGTITIYSYQCLKCDAYHETRNRIKLELYGVYHKITCRSL